MRFWLLLLPIPFSAADTLGIPGRLPGDRLTLVLVTGHAAGFLPGLALALAVPRAAHFLARLLRHVDGTDGGDPEPLSARIGEPELLGQGIRPIGDLPAEDFRDEGPALGAIEPGRAGIEPFVHAGLPVILLMGEVVE